MKTTSKIIIGLLVAIPLLIFIIAILYNNVFVLSEEDRNYYVNNGQLTTIELPACKARGGMVSAAKRFKIRGVSWVERIFIRQPNAGGG